MKSIILIVALCFITTLCFSETEWVKKNASLEKKVEPVAFEVTGKMKTDILKLDEITVSTVKKAIRGSRSQAKKVIKELEDENEILTKNQRYSELYPSPIDTQ